MAGSAADGAATAADVGVENSISRQPQGRRPSSGQLKTLAALSSSILPAFSAGIDIGYQPTLKKYVILRPSIQLFLMVLVFYSAWASPFELAFPRAATGSLLAVDVFFGSDIDIAFFVAYINSSTFLLVDDRGKIAKRYLTRPWFVMDVVSTIPFQIIYRILTGKTNGVTVFGVINLLRLWRLRRASNLFARDAAGKLMFLPDSMDELLKLAGRLFGMEAERILSADGAEIEEICTIQRWRAFVCMLKRRGKLYE